jgi:hypothetical protein
MHGHTIQSILDQPRIFGSCGSIWRQGDVGECKNRPGPQRDPTSSGAVDVSMKVFALWTAMIAHGSHEHAPAERSVFADKLFDAALKLPFFLLALAQPLIKV